MKAIVLTHFGLEGAQVKEVDAPIPKENEVLIKVHASSLNDWDLSMIEGKPFVLRAFYGWRKPRIRTPGCDVAGVVTAKGASVSAFSEGDAVYGDLHNCGFGSLAEYCLAREQDLRLKPKSLSFEQAAALPHAATLAWQAIHQDLRRYAGGSLLINGAGGGVGFIALQLARLNGFQVTGVDKGIKLQALKEAGFSRVVNCDEVDFTREGHQYDLILDVQSRLSPSDYTRALKPNGTYITVGGSLIRLLQLWLLGRFHGRKASKTIRVLALKANEGLSEMAELFESGQVAPLIDGPYRFDEFQHALRRYKQCEQTGRIVIVP